MTLTTYTWQKQISVLYIKAGCPPNNIVLTFIDEPKTLVRINQQLIARLMGLSKAIKDASLKDLPPKRSFTEGTLSSVSVIRAISQGDAQKNWVSFTRPQ